MTYAPDEGIASPLAWAAVAAFCAALVTPVFQGQAPGIWGYHAFGISLFMVFMPKSSAWVLVTTGWLNLVFLAFPLLWAVKDRGMVLIGAVIYGIAALMALTIFVTVTVGYHLIGAGLVLWLVAFGLAAVAYKKRCVLMMRKAGNGPTTKDGDAAS